MKIFVTKEYFDKSQRKVRELQERLAQIRNDKTAAYTEDTNTWHDNFAYEHLTREEKQTEKNRGRLMPQSGSHRDKRIPTKVPSSIG